MFTSNQQNKDLCKFKSNTSNSISQESNNSTDNIVDLLNNGVTFKTALKNSNNETLRIKGIFSFVKEEESSNSFVCDNESPEFVSSPLPKFEAAQTVDEHYCGMLNNELHFQEEANKKGLFKSCCHFGKVKLQRAKKYPEMLQNLMTMMTERVILARILGLT